jgi:hypothetical protein
MTYSTTYHCTKADPHLYITRDLALWRRLAVPWVGVTREPLPATTMSAKKPASKVGLVDKAKAHELNMAVLKRIDPETEEVGPPEPRSSRPGPRGATRARGRPARRPPRPPAAARPRQAPGAAACRARHPSLSLSLLQILASAGQVCLYKMSVDDQQWVSSPKGRARGAAVCLGTRRSWAEHRRR